MGAGLMRNAGVPITSRYEKDGRRSRGRQLLADCQQPHHAVRAALHLREFRTRVGLNAPYGPKAVTAYGVRRYRHTPHERWELQLPWKERCKSRRAEAKRAAREGRL